MPKVTAFLLSIGEGAQTISGSVIGKNSPNHIGVDGFEGAFGFEYSVEGRDTTGEDKTCCVCFTPQNRRVREPERWWSRTQNQVIGLL